MAITIVSLAWNGAELTDGFLSRLKKHTDIEHQLVFADNGSEENITKVVKKHYPKATFTRYGKNIGCPATRNPSMKMAENEVVFWLDNDTYVGEGWYKPFMEMLDQDMDYVGVDGLRVRNAFDPGNPWRTPEQFAPNPYVDWFVGYAVAFKKSKYMPIPDWDLKVNMDDVDLGIGIKVNGGTAWMLRDKPNLEHLTSQTARDVRPNSQKTLDVLDRWWKYWSPHKEVFEDYK
jgi:GT2 family glycosyltransferase